MSVQIVDPEHIKVLIWAGLKAHPDGPLSWTVARSGGTVEHQLDRRTAARVGSMLNDQNIAAYQERYGDDDYDDGLDGDECGEEDAPDTAHSYVHADPERTDWTPIDVHKAIEFYVYNSFHDEDHDQAPTIDALMFCGALLRRIGPDLLGWGNLTFPTGLMQTPEWKASPWGIS